MLNPNRKGAKQMVLSDFKIIFDFIASIATVLILFLKFLNWFFDYKIRQREKKKHKEKSKTKALP